MAETKQILEREYVIPLRREFLKLPRYRRAGRAIKEIKNFIARHMKVYDRDLDKIKLDQYVSHEVWFKGSKNPPSKIKVKAIKEGDIVHVVLAEMPEVHKYHKLKIERRHKKSDKKTEFPKETKAEEKTEEEKKDEQEKAKATAESMQTQQEKTMKADKHTVKQGIKPQAQHRMALQK